MKAFSTVLLIGLFILGASACTPATQAPTSIPTLQPTATPAPTVAPTVQPTPAPTPQPTLASPQDFDYTAESIGPVRMKMTESELLAAIGQPDSESKAEVWGADGMEHSDWTYQAKGLTVNMTETSNPESEFVVYSITAKVPCGLKTQRGIKIGDTKEAVKAAYADAIDPAENVSQDEIVAGTVFSGMVFTIEDGLVNGIFIGASAE